MQPRPDPIAAMAAAVVNADRRAIAKAITAVECESAEGAALLKALHSRLGHARVIGVTGPPGAGKSTLVNVLIGEFRRRGRRVGVIAVDPSSPISGGAILGDRIRMIDHGTDDGVFIRSLASRGHLGGLSRSAARAVDVLDAAGFDVVIVETVGAGQSEVEVADIAHTRIVVCPPGLGDDVQAIKAGILEIADIFAVNKSDTPLAERAERELLAMLSLRARAAWVPPVIRTVATTGAGVKELADAVEAHGQTGADPRHGVVERLRRVVANLAADEVRSRIVSRDNPELNALAETLRRGEVDYREAALRALEVLGIRHD
ncbi:MAG: methylmalonyl Co-A mutase-associated GTPase MeaB [Betaproteobacteria bacterium]|nr:methylmalonyl Co-A mutase-associated GTPase MeaB [Betaproteobacteria bacterium]